jgi:hypothetical protein
MSSLLPTVRVVLCVTFALLLLKRSSSTCNSGTLRNWLYVGPVTAARDDAWLNESPWMSAGVLRMQFPPTLEHCIDYNDCYAWWYRQDSTGSIKCTVAYKAAVNGSGVLRLVPLSTATYNGLVSPPWGGDADTKYCRELNASGLLQGGPPSWPRRVAAHDPSAKVQHIRPVWRKRSGV